MEDDVQHDEIFFLHSTPLEEAKTAEVEGGEDTITSSESENVSTSPSSLSPMMSASESELQTYWAGGSVFFSDSVREAWIAASNCSSSEASTIVGS